MSPELIKLLLYIGAGLFALIAPSGSVGLWLNRRHVTKMAEIQNEREKEQLESANEREQLKNEMQEIRKDQGLIDVFSKVVEGIGRMDRSIRETSQAYTSALEQNTQSINKIDESVTMSNGKVENQYETIANTLESINDVLGTIKVSDEKQHEKLDGVIKDLNRISDKLETMSETEQATLTVDKSAVVTTYSDIDLDRVQTPKIGTTNITRDKDGNLIISSDKKGNE